MSEQPPSYGDSLTTVEPFGIDHIPDHERHGKPSSQFFGAAAAIVLYLLTYRFPYLWHRRTARASPTREEPAPR